MTSSGLKQDYKIVYAKFVVKDIKDIENRSLKKIKSEIEKLAQFPDIENIRKLTNHPVSDFRMKVGDYRVLFDVDNNERVIFILKIGHRREVY